MTTYRGLVDHRAKSPVEMTDNTVNEAVQYGIHFPSDGSTLWATPGANELPVTSLGLQDTGKRLIEKVWLPNPDGDVSRIVYALKEMTKKARIEYPEEMTPYLVKRRVQVSVFETEKVDS